MTARTFAAKQSSSVSRLILLTAICAFGFSWSCRSTSKSAPDKNAPNAASPLPPTARAPKSASKSPLNWSSAQILAGQDPAPLADDEILWRSEYEGQSALEVRFSHPYMAVADAKGGVYIADKDAHALRRVDSDGTVHTLAGTGIAGNGKDTPQPARECALSHPNGVWVSPDGIVYILDRDNGKVRRINADQSIQTVTTVADGVKTGRGLWLSPDQSTIWISAGDRLLRARPPKAPEVLADGFISLANLALRSDGSVIAADRGANLVYSIAPDGQKSVIAGNGDSAASPADGPARKHGLNGPRAVVVLADQSILIATQRGQRIWRWSQPKDATAQLSLVFDAQKPAKTHALQSSKKVGPIRGLSQSPTGDLLLTHSDAGQVLRFPQR